MENWEKNIINNLDLVNNILAKSKEDYHSQLESIKKNISNLKDVNSFLDHTEKLYKELNDLKDIVEGRIVFVRPEYIKRNIFKDDKIKTILLHMEQRTKLFVVKVLKDTFNLGLKQAKDIMDSAPIYIEYSEILENDLRIGGCNYSIEYCEKSKLKRFESLI